MNRKIKRIIAIQIIIELIIVVAFGIGIYIMQSNLITDLKTEELQTALDGFDEKLEERNANLAYFESEYDSMLISKADQAAYYIDHLEDKEADTITLRDLASVIEAEEVHIITASGNVTASSTAPAVPLTPEHIHAAGSNCVEEAGDRQFRTYAAPLKDGSYVVLRMSADDFNSAFEAVADDDLLFTSTRIGFNGAVLVFDENGTVTYSMDFNNIYEGDNVFDKGITRASVKEDSTSAIKIGGEYHHIRFKWDENTQSWVAFSIPQSMIFKQVLVTVILLVFFVLCILTAFNVYMICLYDQSLNDINKDISAAAQKKEQVDIKALMKSYSVKIRKKVGVVFAIGTVVVFLLSVYLQCMSMISIYSSENFDNLNDIDTRLTLNSINGDLIEETAKKILINKAVTAAYIIGEEPSIWNMDDLDELNTALDTEYLVIFDQAGKEIISNGRFVGLEISNDSKDQSYQLRSLMYGTNYVYTEPTKGEFSGELHQDIGATIRTDGMINGFVVISNNPENLVNLYGFTKAENIYNNTNLLYTRPVVIDKDTHRILYSDGAISEGKEAVNYGFSEEEIRDHFNGFITYNECRYYASSTEGPNGELIYLLTPKEVILSGSLIFAIIISVLILVCLFVCAVVNQFLVGTDLRKLLKDAIHVSMEDEENDNYGYIDVLMPDGTIKKAISVLGRFSTEDVDWDRLTPEKKTGNLIKGFFSILALAVFILLVFRDSIFLGDSSILRYIFSLEWERSINIFSITCCACAICVIIVIEFIVVKVLGRLAIVANAKGETIIRMLRNMSKYIAVIVAFFLCLTYIGVRVTTLLVGAGVLTLIIGLGAQSLISDIINGLFIIFEGDFQVGDIVTIDDFRGTVQEIGVRTTKLLNTGGDLKIIRNSELNDILNMTRKDSKCICELLVDYESDLEKTIELIEGELDAIKDKIPEIVDGPELSGVKELGDNGVKLLIVAYCKEQDIYTCRYSLNKELKLICERNNINIPYQQIVVREGNKK